jgi:TonB family protein
MPSFNYAQKSQMMAGTLSLCCPGLGQVYSGDTRKGFLFICVALVNFVILLQLAFAKALINALVNFGSAFHMTANSDLVKSVCYLNLNSPPAIIFIGFAIAFMAYSSKDAYKSALIQRRSIYPDYLLAMPEATSSSYLLHCALIADFFFLAFFFFLPPRPQPQITQFEFSLNQTQTVKRVIAPRSAVHASVNTGHHREKEPLAPTIRSSSARQPVAVQPVVAQAPPAVSVPPIMARSTPPTATALSGMPLHQSTPAPKPLAHIALQTPLPKPMSASRSNPATTPLPRPSQTTTPTSTATPNPMLHLSSFLPSNPVAQPLPATPGRSNNPNPSPKMDGSSRSQIGTGPPGPIAPVLGGQPTSGPPSPMGPGSRTQQSASGPAPTPSSTPSGIPGKNSGPALAVAPFLPGSKLAGPANGLRPNGLPADGSRTDAQRGNPDTNLRPNDKSNLAAQPAPDFGPYMAELQRRIKRAWYPPKGDSKRIVVIFKIDRGGVLSNLHIERASGVAFADQAALKAVENAAPFPPLPAHSPDDVDIQFTFDYNVFNGSKGVFSRF